MVATVFYHIGTIINIIGNNCTMITNSGTIFGTTGMFCYDIVSKHDA